MELHLTKKPTNVIIITGFPGASLVGTITTKFLLDKLDTEQIGYIHSEELIPIVAIHKGEVIKPLGIFYNKQYNLVIIQALSGILGLEWKLTHIIEKLINELKAKEIINLEGTIGFEGPITAYYYTQSKERKKKLEEIKLEEMKEGIIMGATGALLLSEDKVPVTTIFAKSHSNLPDYEAAAKIVETLDKVLNMKLDYKPLIEKAKNFEAELKNLMEQAQKKEGSKKPSELSYLG